MAVYSAVGRQCAVAPWQQCHCRLPGCRRVYAWYVVVRPRLLRSLTYCINTLPLMLNVSSIAPCRTLSVARDIYL